MVFQQTRGPVLHLLACLLLPSVAYAITIDADTYFAYAKVRGGGYSHYYIMLSKQRCPEKKAPKGWKLAAFNFNKNWGDTSGCWATLDQETVRICPSGQYDSKITNNPDSVSVLPCHELPKAQFIDTSTLPRQAGF